MARYVSLVRPKSHWLDEDPVIVRDVIVEEGGPVATGLYNADGEQLFRVPERVKIGFIAEKK